MIIDIAKKEKGEKTKPEEDVTQWHSTKRNLGPLQEGWYKQTTIPHVMWCYKTVAIKAKYFGIQSLVESLVRRQQEMEEEVLDLEGCFGNAELSSRDLR